MFKSVILFKVTLHFTWSPVNGTIFLTPLVAITSWETQETRDEIDTDILSCACLIRPHRVPFTISLPWHTTGPLVSVASLGDTERLVSYIFRKTYLVRFKKWLVTHVFKWDASPASWVKVMFLAHSTPLNTDLHPSWHFMALECTSCHVICSTAHLRLKLKGIPGMFWWDVGHNKTLISDEMKEQWRQQQGKIQPLFFIHQLKSCRKAKSLNCLFALYKKRH